MSLQIIQAVRDRYPKGPLGAKHGEFLISCITALGPSFGLFKKDAGSHVMLSDGTNVSLDLIINSDDPSNVGWSVWDILIDSDGDAIPSWSFNSTLTDHSKFYRPDNNNGDLDSIKKQILKLQGDIEALRSAAIKEGDLIGLLADNQKFVSADFAIDKKLVANRDAKNAWETFKVTR